MSIKTFFSNSWAAFITWFDEGKAAVVSEGKTIIDELEPVVRADILADGGTALATVGAALVAGTDPLLAIEAAAKVVFTEALAQGINISKAASTTAGAFLVAKAKAIAVAASSPAPAAGTTASTTSAS